MILRNIKTSKVLFFEADSNYTTVFYADGSKTLSAYTLKVFEEIFCRNKQFLRINKSVIINRSYMMHYERVNTIAKVFLCNGKHLIVSRRRVRELESN